jgi:hypothetical protein
MNIPSYAGLHKPSMSLLLTRVRAVEAATPPPVCRGATAPSLPAAHFASAHAELTRTVGGGDSARRASIRRVDLDSSASSIDSTVCCSIRRCRISICTAGGSPPRSWPARRASPPPPLQCGGEAGGISPPRAPPWRAEEGCGGGGHLPARS